MEPEELLSLLEERLVKHDKNREEVQSELHEVCAKALEGADSTEEKISREINDVFGKKEEEILGLIEKLNKGGDDTASLISKAHEELSSEINYSINPYYSEDSCMDIYKFTTRTVTTTDKEIAEISSDSNAESVVKRLQELLDKVHEKMTSAQSELTEIYAKRRKDVKTFEEKINEKLEPLFAEEDGRIQEVVKDLREKIGSGNPAEVEEPSSIARAILVVIQKYAFTKPAKGSIFDSYELGVTHEKSLKYLGIEKRKPTNVTASFTANGHISFSFDVFTPKEVSSLEPFKIPLRAVFVVWESGRELTTLSFTEPYAIGEAKEFSFNEIFTPCTKYSVKMRIEDDAVPSGWSDATEFVVPDFKARCGWKEGPEYTCPTNGNPRVATSGEGSVSRIIVGNTSLPTTATVSWDIRISESNIDDRDGTYIGVAPSSISIIEDKDIYRKCGWYFNCKYSLLCSGPPHNYFDREYGPRKKGNPAKNQQNNTVGVEVNTAFGEISFSVNGKSFGVAYSGIPLDKPLVPCVILFNKGISAEIVPTKMVEIKVDPAVPVPSKVKAKSRSWDSIDIKWDSIRGASSYQVDVDRRIFVFSSSIKEFTKETLNPGTEHSIRVRAIKGTSVGGWNALTKERTLDAPDFSGCCWKKCPETVDERYGYAVDDNPRVATMTGFGGCTIVGTVPLPLEKVTAWSIKVLKSRNNDNFGIWVGVVPFDVDQNDFDNSKKAGWHFYCYSSTLWSGPPHNCYNEAYKKGDAKKVRILKGATTIRIVADTVNRSLSFATNGTNLGIAFEGITLDKPLIPSVILKRKGDSVELLM